MGGQYTPPPLPSTLPLRVFLETIYLSSMETDEARSLRFTICGSSWSYARQGYQYHHDQIPHAFLLRAEGPGHLVAYQGQYRVAALIAGEVVRPEGVSVFDLSGAYPVFSEAHDFLRPDVIPPQYETAREWHQFEWIAVINAILSIVNTIQQKGHGGALIVACQTCELDELLRMKYSLSQETNDLRGRFVQFLNLRHRQGDMLLPPQFKKDAPEETDRVLYVRR